MAKEINKIKYKIVVEHKDKGTIEIPISNKLLHSIADIPFMMEDCLYCWKTFKLNKIDKDVKKFHDIMLFLAFDVDGDGFAYQMINSSTSDLKKKKKGEKLKWKKVKSNFILIKKPKYKPFKKNKDFATN